jgi:hypothetical protein
MCLQAVNVTCRCFPCCVSVALCVLWLWVCGLYFQPDVPMVQCAASCCVYATQLPHLQALIAVCCTCVACSRKKKKRKVVSGEYVCKVQACNTTQLVLWHFVLCERAPWFVLNPIRHRNCSALSLQLCRHTSQHACATLLHCNAASARAGQAHSKCLLVALPV